MYGDYFYHHGVKGMRWGIIRTPEQFERSGKRYLKKSGGYTPKDSASEKTKQAYYRAVDTYAKHRKAWDLSDKTWNAAHYIPNKKLKYKLRDDDNLRVHKRVFELDDQLRGDVNRFLSTLSKKERAGIVKYDAAEGQRYVESTLFDKKNLEFNIYIDTKHKE